MVARALIHTASYVTISYSLCVSLPTGKALLVFPGLALTLVGGRAPSASGNNSGHVGVRVSRT